MVTTGSGCPKSKSMTMEDGVLKVAAAIKAKNPAAIVGMYWRTDMALEIAECSNGTAELAKAGTAWFLKDDNGTLVKKGKSYLWDYENAAGKAFWTKTLLNVVQKTLPNGKPNLDYLYLDGPSWGNVPTISAARNAAIAAAKYTFHANLQRECDALPGGGRNVILNGCDNPATAALFSSTGAAGTMFDHWSILQYTNRGADYGCNKNGTGPKGMCGTFNATAMDEAFALVRSKILSNMTLQVKGWVGPVIKQQGHYPPQIPTPATPAEQAIVAGERFNSELALFLLVAEENTFWMFSWFWGFDSWVPGQADSQTPKGFYPQAKCQLGAPKGPPVRKAGTVTYTREYEHASVFVDLDHRNASKVDFKGTC